MSLTVNVTAYREYGLPVPVGSAGLMFHCCEIVVTTMLGDYEREETHIIYLLAGTPGDAKKRSLRMVHNLLCESTPIID